ncbi:hypothetical protein BT96DRAFT_1017636 [Gymnopus androsaceus JB14]|uniref:Uncharacterized protein n=1 Tax=Gymnopus androsaceus JB14 TaxID=1447944 RepID=A0A6A4I0S9_9AGAR|nr:hypothetical protein BT96DRAFT_1017636 [Gymnopus androsaceus JB14]
MSTVWLMVDDDDTTDLDYLEPHSWTRVSSTTTMIGSGKSFDAGSIRGPAYDSTLHFTSQNTSINFRFNGSSFFGVYGSLDLTSPYGTLPNISCLLDGLSAPISAQHIYAVGNTNNNYLACSANSGVVKSNPGEHQLLITVTNFVNSSWYFDYLTYESLANPQLNGELIQAGNAQLIPSADYSGLTFGPNWFHQGADESTETTVLNSKVTFQFNGTSVSLYGDLDTNISNTASYQIDGSSPVIFQLPEDGMPSNTLNNILLFNHSNLSIGEHTLVVTSNGSNTGTPLDINYFLAQSLTTEEQASLSSHPFTNSTATPNAPTGSSISHSGNANTKVIVGAALGAVSSVLLVTAATFYGSGLNQGKRRNF